MELPVIVDTNPVKIEVKQGETYYWCSCGKSNNQPFCDGTHVGSRFEPVAFTAEKTGSVYVCQCKQTKDSPFCDGAHSNISD